MIHSEFHTDLYMLKHKTKLINKRNCEETLVEYK